MKIMFRHATNRNTKCYRLVLGDVRLGISYDTVVSVAGPHHGNFTLARLRNSWGPTTGRHMRELGCSEYAVIDDEDEFQELVQSMVSQQALNAIKARLDTPSHNAHQAELASST